MDSGRYPPSWASEGDEQVVIRFCLMLGWDADSLEFPPLTDDCLDGVRHVIRGLDADQLDVLFGPFSPAFVSLSREFDPGADRSLELSRCNLPLFHLLLSFWGSSHRRANRDVSYCRRCSVNVGSGHQCVEGQFF